MSVCRFARVRSGASFPFDRQGAKDAKKSPYRQGAKGRKERQGRKAKSFCISFAPLRLGGDKFFARARAIKAAICAVDCITTVALWPAEQEIAAVAIGYIEPLR